MADIDKTLAKRSRAHTIYKTKDGTRVPGVTTILGILAKPALIVWANRMGLQGIDTTKYVAEAADAGTAAHEMIECHLKGIPFDTSQYAPEILDLAENGYLKYLDWESHHEIKLIASEMALVSETYRFGGTVDMYCELDGKRTLVDFKTNQTGIYPEMMHQTAGGYRVLLEENGYPVQRVLIIRLGKSDSMDLETKEVAGWVEHWEMFHHCQAIYNLQKTFKAA